MLLSSSLLALKILLISSGVVSFIVVLNYTVIKLPSIWSIMLLLCKPPYIYVVVNGIIISIAASSRYAPVVESSIPPPEVEVSRVEGVAVIKEERVLDVKAVVVNGVKVAEETEVSEISSDCDKLEPKISREIATFGRKKPPKTGSHRGQRKQILANMEMEGTLESTWKMITEERHKERVNPTSQDDSLLDQDELTRRVEEFIKKFNEELRLQRQESMEQMMNRKSND